MSLRVLSRISAPVVLKSKEDVSKWTRTLDEEKTRYLLCTLIELGAHEEFERILYYGLCITDTVISQVLLSARQHPNKRIMRTIQSFRLETYSSLGVRLAIFCNCFELMKFPFPSSESLFLMTLRPRILKSRFDPMLFLCGWNDPELMEWVMKIRPVNKEDYVNQIKENGCDRLFSLLTEDDSH